MEFKNKRQFLDLMEYLWEATEGGVSISSMLIERDGAKKLFELVLPNGKEVSVNKISCDVKNHKWDSETFCYSICEGLKTLLPKAKNISFSYNLCKDTWVFKIDDESLSLRDYSNINSHIKGHDLKPPYTKVVVEWSQYRGKFDKHCEETAPKDTHGWN